MEFAIGTLEFWYNHGFNVQFWRKSVDGTKALVHLPYAELLVPDIRNQTGIEIYLHPSDEFISLLNSPEWSEVDAS